MTFPIDWQHRLRFVIPDTQVAGDLTDFPIVLTSATIPDHVFANSQTSGQDIRITKYSDGQGALPVEIVEWSTSASAELWFKADLTTIRNNRFYLWYGNTSATLPDASATSGSDYVWNNDFEAVWHLGDFNDSTSANHDLGNSGTISATGLLGSSRSFNATARDFLSASGTLGDPAVITIEALVNVDTVDSGGGEIVSIQNRVGIRADENGPAPGGTGGFYFESPGWTAVRTGVDLSGTGWRYVAYTVNPSSSAHNFYIDGSLSQTSGATSAISYITGNTFLGRHSTIDGYDYDGLIDDIQISTVERNADWFSARYNNFTSGTNFVQFDEVCVDETGDEVFPDDWSEVRRLIINSNLVEADLTDFPVLVTSASIPESVLTGAKADGSDIRFSFDSSGTQQIPFEIVNFDVSAYPTSAIVEIWIKVPQVSALEDTFFYIWYGNTSASFYCPEHQYGSWNVWEDKHWGVWHMNEDPATGTLLDSTSALHHGTPETDTSALVSEDLVLANFGYGINFEFIKNQYYDMGIPVSGTKIAGIEAWLQLSTSAITTSAFSNYSPPFPLLQRHYVVDAFDSSLNTGLRLFRGNESNPDSPPFLPYTLSAWDSNMGNGVEHVHITTSAHALDDVTWQHITVHNHEEQGSHMRVNGSSEVSASMSAIPETGGNFPIRIAHRNENFPRYFDGTIAEVRIFKEIVSDAFLLTSFNNSSSADEFFLTTSGDGALVTPAVTLSGVGQLGKTGTGALILGSVSASGEGQRGQDGSGDLDIGFVTVNGLGQRGQDGTGVLTIPAVILNGVGEALTPVSGTGVLITPAVELSGVGEASTVGSGDLITPSVELSGVGEALTSASGSGALITPAVELSGVGILSTAGTGDLITPAVEVSGTGEALSSLSGTGSLEIPKTCVSGVGHVEPRGSGDLIIPKTCVNGVGFVTTTIVKQNQLVVADLLKTDRVEEYAYDLHKNVLTRGETINDSAINISIENILSTIRGEKLFTPRFGTILPLVPFEHLNLASAQELLRILLRDIRRFEKRVTVITEQVKMDLRTDENSLTLVIPYVINRNGLNSTFSRKIIL